LPMGSASPTAPAVAILVRYRDHNLREVMSFYLYIRLATAQ
jgi:hypothetical protein